MAKRRKGSKPPKPYPDFPLTPHPNGQWCKQVRKKLYYFGTWDDWRGALSEYEAFSKSPIPEASGELDLATLCNLFLDFKEKQSDSGDIERTTYEEYRRACGRCLDILGRTILVDAMQPAHFQVLRDELAKRFASPVTLRNEIVKLRALFAWAHDSGNASNVLRFKTTLTRPPERLLRAAKNARESRMYFEAAEVKKLLKHAKGSLKPAVYLGINAAFGNRDICEVQWSDIKGDKLSMARVKTEIKREAKLWPETVKALAAWKRSSPKSDWVFCGEHGQQLGQGEGNSTPFSKLFRSLMTTAGVDVDAEGAAIATGRGFYTLRHSFRTAADSCLDQVGINFVMGHSDVSMAGNYRHLITDERLEKIANHVRQWLGLG